MEDNKKNADQNANLEDNNQNQNNEPEVNEPNGESNNNSGSNNDSNSEKTFTQSQVSSMMAKEKKQGKNSAYNELGIDSEDEELMKTVKEFVEFKKSSKAKEDEPNSNSNSELEQKLVLAEAKIEALALGVKSQYVDDIITLVASRIGGESDLKTVLAEYKLKYPAWFGLTNDGTEDEDANNPDKNGTGSTLRTKTKKSDPENSIGSRLAAQRVSRQKNSNFWGK
jgi:hypothetical protein